MQIVANASEFCLLSRDQCEKILFFFSLFLNAFGLLKNFSYHFFKI